jgi:hypothetical protein
MYEAYTVNIDKSAAVGLMKYHPKLQMLFASFE